MKSLSKIVAGTLLLVSFGSISPAMALRAVREYDSGTTARFSVSHKGAPVKVRIVAIRKDGSEIEEAKAFPAKLTTNRKDRSVVVKFTPDTYAVCATTSHSGFRWTWLTWQQQQKPTKQSSS